MHRLTFQFDPHRVLSPVDYQTFVDYFTLCLTFHYGSKTTKRSNYRLKPIEITKIQQLTAGEVLTLDGTRRNGSKLPEYGNLYYIDSFFKIKQSWSPVIPYENYETPQSFNQFLGHAKASKAFYNYFKKMNHLSANEMKEPVMLDILKLITQHTLSNYFKSIILPMIRQTTINTIPSTHTDELPLVVITADDYQKITIDYYAYSDSITVN